MAYEYTRENNLKESSCILISKRIETDDNGVTKEVGEPIEREVYCLVGSIYMKEFYSAYQAGIKPQYRLKVNIEDYNDELIVKFEGVIYNIYRTYPTGDEIELYIRSDVSQWNK